MKSAPSQLESVVRIAKNVPIKKIRQELARNSYYWDHLNNDRHLRYKVQREAKAILLVVGYTEYSGT